MTPVVLMTSAAGGLASPLALGALLAVVAGAVALVVVRRAMVRRALGRRVRVQMVPTDAFDPPVEAVTRFAAGLGRTRRVVHNLLDLQASAARLRLTPDAAGRLRYEVELPAHARNALATATYPDVELHDTTLEPAEATAPDAPTGTGPAPEPGRAVAPGPAAATTRKGRAVARVELVLARPSSSPLRDIGLDPDPLAAIARATATVNTDAGESATACVDLLPVTAAGRRRIRRRLLRQARRDEEPRVGNGPSVSELLLGRPPGRGGAPPAELVQRRSGQRALTAKLGNPEPLFQIQVLLHATATEKGRAVNLVRSLASAFDQFAGENYFRASGLRLPGGLAFLGADSRLRRRRFDRRLASGRFRPARRRIVGASEIAGLLKPPSAKCLASNVVRSGGLIPPPPPGLPTFHGQPGLLPLGRVGSGTGERLVGVPLKDTFFSYMGGRSRYGKTETAIGQALHLARAGHGVFFLDPHEDAVRKLKRHLTDQGLRERVIEVNLADPDRQPGWNLFAAHGLPAGRRAERVDAVVDAFAATMGWGEQNTRALNLVSQSAQALTELAARLPTGLAPTLLQIPSLLGNESWRTAVLPHVSPATRAFFLERFPRLSSEAITPITNLIDRLRVAPAVAALLGTPVSTYDVRNAMDRGLIVLACPGTGSTRDRLIASLLVYDLLHQAKTRANLPPDRRRPFYVFLDEVQTYDSAGADTLAALLEQSAKFGLRVFLLNQNPERLSPATWNAVSTNRSHLSSTALASKAAALLAREWAGQIEPEVVTRLERYTYLASVTLDMQVSPPFLVHGTPVEELFPDADHPEHLDRLEAAIDRTTGRRPVAGTVARLDDHDEAILHALQRQTDDNRPGQPSPRGSRGTRTLSAPRRSPEGQR
ncbi:hypothetical protein AB0L40_05285 [Patulibacter sp. NPDC049589]|uniref:hypothetical protein n=1 Tax=Patulibacter sp. NPDC049589 TaxID=3154731 RepID=UPI00343BA5BE